MNWEFDRKRRVGPAVLVAALLFSLPALAAAAETPLLPDRDVRTLEELPPQAEQRQAKLDDRREQLEAELGPLGFADEDERLGATGFVGRSDGYLSERTNQPARDVALDYVVGHSGVFGLDQGDIDSLELTDAYTSWEGVRHLTFTQIVGGYPSYDTSVRANVDEDGRLINVSGGPVGDLALDDPDPALSKEQALLAARNDVGGTDDAQFGDLESARLVAFVYGPGDAELAWEVYADTPEGLLYEVVVGADSGEILKRESRTHFANQADVWDLHPNKNVAPTRVDLGADPLWIDDTAGGTKLRGNNAHAYADVNNNNLADASEEVAQVGGDWIFPITFFNHAECPAFGCTWDSTDNTTKATNQSAATTGLFYLSNRFHDHLLQPPIGFDEASGNFEQVNSSGQGAGGDRILAEANDGSGLNNANFSTPRDGTPGRMQQYFFTDWDVTSSDDAAVVYHEYGHGLSNRLATLGTLQSGAMGEGWSDWYAMDYLVASGEIVDGAAEDLIFGGYSKDFGTGSGGFRNQRMDCDPGSISPACPGAGTTGPGGFTLGDMGNFCCGGNRVHDNGEIWSQTLWDLREEIGADDARAVVTGGLRLAPVSPSFLQMRDAIVQSAGTLEISRAAIWEVFAARGMGFSASTPGSTIMDSTEAFDLPPPLIHRSSQAVEAGVPSLADGDGYAEPGETLTFTTTLDKWQPGTAVTGIVGEISSPTAGLYYGTKTTNWPDASAAFEGLITNVPAMSATIPEVARCGGDIEFSVAVDSSAGEVAVPGTQVFSVGAPTFESTSPDLSIPGNVTWVTGAIEMPPGEIDDMDVSLGDLTYGGSGGIAMNLTSPEGTTVKLLFSSGVSPGLDDLILDDEADGGVNELGGTGAPVGGRVRPIERLSAFDGEDAGGTWTLTAAEGTGNPATLHTWGLKDGSDCSTTAAPLATVSTGVPASVGATAAELTAEIDPRGAETAYAIEYGTGDRYDQLSAAQSAGGGNGAVSRTATISDLRPQTKYEYRAVALRGGTVIARGENRTFITAALGCETARTDLELAEQRLARAQQSLAVAERRQADAGAALPPAETAVERAKKKLAKAKARLEEAKESGDSKEVKKAKKKLRRVKKAVKAANAGVDQAAAELDAAKAAHTQARDELAAASDALPFAQAAVKAHCP